MSHMMTAMAMRQKGLKPATKIVLYWLADHHNGETGDCFPSINRLVECCEMSKASVVRHLDELEERGFIVREQRSRGNGSQTSTSYIIQQNRLSQNETGAVSKCDRGLSQNETPITLEDINLGNEPTPLFPQGGGDDDFSAKKTERQDLTDEFFNDWWNLFPKREGANPKKSALASFKRALKKIQPDQLMLATAAFAVSRQGEDPKFTPMASTWLNQERWDQWTGKAASAARMNPDNPMDGIPEEMAKVIRYEIDPVERDKAARAYWASREAAE